MFRKNAIKDLLTHGVATSNEIFETKNPHSFCYLPDTFQPRNKRKDNGAFSLVVTEAGICRELIENFIIR